MLKKAFRSAVSFALVICLLLGMSGNAIALAANYSSGAAGSTEPAPPVKYVSLGDSMVNGYGLPGYEYEYHAGDSSLTECTDVNCTEEHVVFHWSNGYDQVAPEAYPARLAEYFGWELTQLAMSAMRVEDLHWLLEMDYTDANALNVATGAWNEALWNETFTNGDYWTWDEFTTGRLDNLYPSNKTRAELVAEVAKNYQDSVAGADVISLGIGNGNFGVFMLGRIMEAVGFDKTPTYDNYHVESAIRNLDAKTQAEILKMVDEIYAQAEANGIVIDDGDDNNTSMMEALMNTVVYVAVSYVINYRGVLDAIVELNPDAEIIIVGLMNTMEGMKFNVGGEVVDFGELMGTTLGVVSSYMAALPVTLQAAGEYPEATFYYAEAANVDVLVNNYADEIAKGNATVRDRFVTEIVGTAGDPGMVWELLIGLTEANDDPADPSTYEDNYYVYITREQIEYYEELPAYSTEMSKVSYASQYPREAQSIAVYLAFEDAILAASDPDDGKEPVLSLESLLNLGNLGSIFDGVFADYEENLKTDTTALVELSAGQITTEDVKAFMAGTYAAALSDEVTVKEYVDANLDGFVAFVCDMNTRYALAIEAHGGIENTLVSGADYYVEPVAEDGNSDCSTCGTACAEIYFYYIELAGIEEEQAKEAVLMMLASAQSVLGAGWTLLATPTSLSEALVADETVFGLLNLFARCLIGDGLGAHPSAQGHATLAEAIIATYENGYTAQDKVINDLKKALNAVADLVVEYYDDAYAYAYANSGEYIAAANTAIDAAIEKLAALDLSDSEMTPAFKAEVAHEVEEIIEALTAVKALLNGADVLDQETLDLAIAALDEAGEAVENLKDLLAQAGEDVTELVIVPAIEAAIEYVEEVAIPAAIEAAEKMAAEALNYLVEKLEEAYPVLVNAAVEAAKKYAPELADAIYDYLYNNPEEVISFVKTYGPYVLELCEEYGDEILGVVGYVLYNYGEDIAALIIENHEAILSGIIAWAEVHGENTIKLIQVYAEALGLCDAVREQMEELKTELEEMIADLEALAEKLEAELEKLYAELEELKAQLENAAEELKAEIEAAIAEIEAAIAEIEAAIAEIENAIAELQAELAEVIAEIKAVVEAVEGVFEALNELAEAVASGAADAIMDAVDAVQTALDNLAKVVEAAEQTIEYINEIIDALQELGVEIADVIESLKNAVENLDDVIAEIVDELEAKLEETVEELKAELEAVIDELLAMVEAEVAAALEELVAELEALAEELVAEAVALAEELLATVEELLNEAAAELVAILTDLFNDATHADYLINQDSAYVAIGDNTAYAELLNAYLAELVAGTDKAGYKYPDATLIQSTTIAGAPAAIQNNLAAIAGADLISIGYGNDTFATQAIDAMMAALMYGTYAEYDWVALLGEDVAVYAAEAMAKVYAMLVEQGLADVVIPTAKANLADAMMAAVESYVYNVAVYGLYMPEIVSAIQEINPDAQIIIVGMSNPFAGTVFAYEDMAINVGEYVDYIVDAANIYGVTYAILSENVTFVPAPEAESGVTNQTIEMGITFVAEYLQGKWSFATTEAGNAYIAEQIKNALTITVETIGLLGDADSDGDVDVYDAQLVLAYVTGDPTKKELIDLSVSDVDADGDVDVYDAQAILAYVTGGTEKLPAE